jgi:hypothetical protein
MNISELQDQVRKFWAPRLAKVDQHYVAGNGPGRRNSNDHACITMQLLRPLLSDFSIYDALSVLNAMSNTPELAGTDWNVTYSTFRKRTEARALHKAYYKEVDISQVTWTTANLQYAISRDNWDEHMEMLAEVAVAVQAVYGFNALDMACKALEILDTLDPAVVSKNLASKAENTPEKKKQKGKKRSHAAANLETPTAVPAPTRNQRPKRNTVCTYKIKDQTVIKLEAGPRRPVKKAVRATTTPVAPPAPAPSSAPVPASSVINMMEIEVLTQRVIDQDLLRVTEDEDILISFPDPLALLFLEELKVFEISVDQAPAAEEPAPQQKQQRSLQQVKLPDMLPELRDCDLFGSI